MLDDEGKLPSEWSLAQQTAAVTMARLWLQFANRGHAEVSQVLKAALAGSPSADATWKTTARSLIVVALARQTGRGAEAGAMLAKLADGSPEDLLIMLWNLDRIGRAAPAKSRVELAKLSLQATNLLLTKQLSDAKMTQVQRIRAEAFVAAGQRTNALALYESLAKTHSTNGPIQVGYGQLLLDGDDDKESQERALVQWRKIDRASRPRSDRWWKAKYSIALAQYNLSRYYKTRNAEQATLLKNRAEQLLQYLKAMPPGWENSALKAKFEQLLKSCEG